MTSEILLTQASAKPALTCPDDNCRKQLSSKQSVTQHFKRFHEGVQAGLRTIFTSPAPGPSTAPQPADASAANPIQRQLQFNQDTERLLNEEVDVLVAAAKEEQDLLDALDIIVNTVIEPENEEETRKIMKEKIDRYSNIMKKKTELQKQTTQNIIKLEKQVIQLKEDIHLSEEVVETNKSEFNDKDKIIEGLVKEARDLKKDNEKLSSKKMMKYKI